MTILERIFNTEVAALAGSAKNIRRTTSVTGGGNDNGVSVSTSHIATFELNGRPVTLGMASPPCIEEGDAVTVYGQNTTAGFFAEAYKNSTRSVSADGSSYYVQQAGVLGVIGGAVSAIGFYGAEPKFLPIVFVCVALLVTAVYRVGLYGLRLKRSIR